MVAYSKIVVAGGGIIGNSISYYLARRHSVPCTIIDPVGIAPAASGKAGGFLARDWSDHSPVGELQRRSFDLHAEQAKDLGEANIDYRRLEAAAVMLQEGGMASKPSGKKLEGVEWADVNVRGARMLGREDTIAQVSAKLSSYFYSELIQPSHSLAAEHLCTSYGLWYTVSCMMIGSSKETEQCIMGVLSISWIQAHYW